MKPGGRWKYPPGRKQVIVVAGNSSIFSGSSRYASDFSQVIERSLAIAGLPSEQLKLARTKLTSQATATTSLTGKVTSFRNALSTLDNVKAAVTGSVSNGTVAGVAIEQDALPGSYTIQVESKGSSTLTSSRNGLSSVSSPSSQNIDSSDSYTLTAGGVTYDIELESVSLSNLAKEINASGAPVQAVVVNLGSSSAPDYRLSLQSTKLGNSAIQLNDGSTDLLDQVSAGTPATYRVNGLPALAPIESDTAVGIEIAPGVKVDLLAAGSSTVNVNADTDGLSNALSSFARAYSDVVDELSKHRGKSGGALSGQAIIGEVSTSLQRLFSHREDGAVKSLIELGMSFSEDGALSFNSATLRSLSATQVQQFLGSTDGSGFLEFADQVVDSLDAISTGVLPIASSSVERQIASTTKEIDAQEERLELIQQRIAAQMAAADALIASLEQQVLYMEGLFKAMAGGDE